MIKKTKIKMLDFNILSLKNAERCEKSYHDINDWSPTDWACAVAGETGEMCNFVKKLKRLESELFQKNKYPDKSNKEEVAMNIIANIGKELADIVIYADLLATRLNLRLGYEVIQKFNETSDKIGSQINL